jgi:SAM-dependent methyltransferase
MAHAMWEGVAAGWADHAEDADRRSAALTERMLDAAAVAPGSRVLVLAGGPGGLGIAAAGRVGGSGTVVLSDVVPAMVETALGRAHACGLNNVIGAVRDLEAVDEPDGTFDAVLCREGLMFAVDHARAVAEIARVLRPRGRVVVAVWGPRADNPWLGIVLDALGAAVGMELPPPGIPGPFALGDEDGLAALLAGAGLVDVRVEAVRVDLEAMSFDEWWSRTRALAGPVSGIVDGLDPDTRARLEDRLRADVAPFTHEGRVVLPGVSLLASATRA